MQQVVEKETHRVLVRRFGVSGRFRRVPPGILNRFVSDMKPNEISGQLEDSVIITNLIVHEF